jgi:hypothetical protein
MVPRPILLAGAAYVSAVSAAAGFVSKPLRPLGYGECRVTATDKQIDPAITMPSSASRAGARAEARVMQATCMQESGEAHLKLSCTVFTDRCR